MGITQKADRGISPLSSQGKVWELDKEAKEEVVSDAIRNPKKGCVLVKKVLEEGMITVAKFYCRIR